MTGPSQVPADPHPTPAAVPDAAPPLPEVAAAAAAPARPASDGPGLVAGDDHPVAVYLARLAPGSRRTQAAALHTIARLVSQEQVNAWGLPWAQLRYAHTHAIRAAIAEKYAPATANRYLAALRGVLREAWRLGQMTGEDLARAVDLPPVRGTRLPAGRAVTAGELAALFASCEPTPGGARDAALLAVLYGSGVRRAEAAALQLDDFNAEQASLRVLRGKGAKSRMTYLPAGGVQAVSAWLQVRGDHAGPLFHPVNRGGRIHTDRGLTGQAIRAILARRATKANVAACRPHDLRRTSSATPLTEAATWP